MNSLVSENVKKNLLRTCYVKGWSVDAMVPGKRPVPGRPRI